MNTFAAIAVLLAFASAVQAGPPSSTSAPARGPLEAGPLRVLCGSSMATPGKELAKQFGDKHSVKVECDFGGSETLLPRVLTGDKADIFICHDPFEQKVKDAKLWSGTAVVGYLRPVVVVKKGNPKQISSIADLAKPGLRIGIGDPRYSTCGEMFVAILKDRSLYDGVMARVVLQARTHTELANGVTIGALDAAVVWNFAAVLYKDKLQVVAVDAKYQEVRVTVLGLSRSPNPNLRDAFLDFCRQDAVQVLFRDHGYGARE